MQLFNSVLASLTNTKKPQQKFLGQLGRQSQQRLGMCLGHIPLPAPPMERHRKEQRMCQAKGMRQSVGQGERRLAALQGLVWIAKDPESPGRIAEASHPGSLPIQKGMPAVLLRIVEGICPHPSWVEPVNRAFTPTADLVAYNQRVRTVFAEAVASGTAAVPLE